MILAGAGYEIQTAGNGTDALRVLGDEDFDAVLSDIMMPELDGQELYHRIREIKPDLAKRMIFVTGDTLNSTTRDFLNATGNLFLSKPFKVDDVIHRVQEALQREALEATETAAVGSR